MGVKYIVPQVIASRSGMKLQRKDSTATCTPYAHAMRACWCCRAAHLRILNLDGQLALAKRRRFWFRMASSRQTVAPVLIRTATRCLATVAHVPAAAIWTDATNRRGLIVSNQS